ncbi:MAG TPA: helix-turn-helix domain-containing protein [Polyangiaceae bacterium]|nr:helix-turn-helix domain-containing protein [Polyangiaceae bacterium]
MSTASNDRKPIVRKAAISLSQSERQSLHALLANDAVSARHARRVRVILLSDEGLLGIEIAKRVQLSVGQVSRIRKAYLARGSASLADKPHPGRRDHAVPRETAQLIARIAASPPPNGRKRWSTRLIAAEVGLTSATIAKVLRRIQGSDGSLSNPTVDGSPPPATKSRPRASCSEAPGAVSS